MAARRFGPYELHEVLGWGATGEVHRARDVGQDRWVALELLPEAFRDDEEHLAGIHRAADVVARLGAPHVVPVHGHGEIDGRPYVDMELVAARPLRAVLAEDGALPADRAVRLVTQVASALDAAHAQGLVHGDVTPSTVLVTEHDFVHVVDFGVARPPVHGDGSPTRDGVASPAYTAPERFTGAPADPRADVYALACLLTECVTGAPPFAGQDLPSLRDAHLNSEPPRPSEHTAGVPSALDDVVARGLAEDPDERFGSAGELAAAAAAAVHGRHSGAARTGGTGDDAGEAGAPAVPTAPPTFRSTLRAAPDAAADPDAGAGLPAAPAGAGRRRALRVLLVAVAVLVVAGVALVAVQASRNRPGAGASAAAGSSSSAPAGAPSSAPPSGAPAGSAAPAPAASLARPQIDRTVPVGRQPHHIAVAPTGEVAYIADSAAGEVAVLDTTTHLVTDHIPIPDGPPQYVAFSPDGATAFVTTYTDPDHTRTALVLIDTATRRVAASLPMPSYPLVPTGSPDGRLLYVPLHDQHEVAVVDLASRTVTARIPVRPNPHSIAVSADGRTGYVADHESNTVSILDLAADREVGTVTVGDAPHRLALSPDGRRVAVVDFAGDEVTVIDTATRAVSTVRSAGDGPQDVTFAPDGRHYYTANLDDRTVSVIDTDAGAVTDRIATGGEPTSVAVTPDGRQAFVTNSADGTVLVLATAG